MAKKVILNENCKCFITDEDLQPAVVDFVNNLANCGTYLNPCEKYAFNEFYLDITGKTGVKIDNVEFTGTDTKTLTFYFADQTILEASFLDLQGIETINSKSPDADGDIIIDPATIGADPSGTASDLMEAHIAQADPHTQYILESEKGINVATLGPDQKLTPEQIPAISIVEYLGAAANEAAMLALLDNEGNIPQKGDWCTRVDLGVNFIVIGNDPTQLSSWTQLTYPVAPVISVNGKTGALTLNAVDVGAIANQYTSEQAAKAWFNYVKLTGTPPQWSGMLAISNKNATNGYNLGIRTEATQHYFEAIGAIFAQSGYSFGITTDTSQVKLDFYNATNTANITFSGSTLTVNIPASSLTVVSNAVATTVMTIRHLNINGLSGFQINDSSNVACATIGYVGSTYQYSTNKDAVVVESRNNKPIVLGYNAGQTVLIDGTKVLSNLQFQTANTTAAPTLNGAFSYNTTTNKEQLVINGVAQNVATEASAIVTGKIIYVDALSPNSTDTRTGVSNYSEGVPFKTAAAALPLANNGDVIIFKGGTYAETVTLTGANRTISIILENYTNFNGNIVMNASNLNINFILRNYSVMNGYIGQPSNMAGTLKISGDKTGKIITTNQAIFCNILYISGLDVLDVGTSSAQAYAATYVSDLNTYSGGFAPNNVSSGGSIFENIKLINMTGATWQNALWLRNIGKALNIQMPSDGKQKYLNAYNVYFEYNVAPNWQNCFYCKINKCSFWAPAGLVGFSNNPNGNYLFMDCDFEFSAAVTNAITITPASGTVVIARKCTANSTNIINTNAQIFEADNFTNAGFALPHWPY